MKVIALFTTIICASWSVSFWSSAAERSLARVNAPDHDPLFVVTSSIRRSGSHVTFSYVMDVPAVAEGRVVTDGWKSNEVEAIIDCAQNTYSIVRLIAYAGPRSTGAITGGHTPPAAERTSEKIVAKSTFAYLANYVCAKR